MNESKDASGTEENKPGFWDGVRESAKEVQSGPPWKKAGITLNEAHFTTFAPDSDAEAPLQTK